MKAFSDTIDGIGEVCRALKTPVTGGNVSFYNETEGRGIYPQNNWQLTQQSCVA